MSKAAQCGIKHVARFPEDPAMPGKGGAPFARDFDKPSGNVYPGDLCAAISRSDGQRAGAAASIEYSGPAQIDRQPIEQSAAHLIPARTHCGANAADLLVRGQIDPCLARGAVKIGRQFLAPVSIAIDLCSPRGSVAGEDFSLEGFSGARSHHSNPRKSKMSRSFIGAASCGSTPAHSIAASRKYSSCA